MAIEEFGESLLSNVREQNERLARKERKREEKYATYGLGLNLAKTMGNQILAEKTQDFLSNEKIISARTNQNKAITFANTFIQEQNAIGNKDIGVYFYDKIKPQVEAELQITTSPGQRANISKYNALVDKTTKERAKKASAAHLQGYELATKIAKEEDFENVIAMNPTTMQGWLTGSLRRAFSNKTKEQLDNEAFQAILEGPLAKNTEAMLKFKKAYIQTNSLEHAVDVTKDQLSEVSTDISVDSIVKETLPGGETSFAVVTTTTSRTGRVTVELNRDQELNAERTEKIFLSQIKRDLNLFDMAANSFSDEGQSKFYASLKEAGIPVTGIYSSTENINKASEIFQDLLADKSNYKNKEKADLHKAVISALIPNLVDLGALMKKTDDKGKLTQEGVDIVANIVDTVERLVNELDNTSSNTDDSSNETGNESNNFDITWPGLNSQ
jgi:hypothetical protein